MRGHLWAVVVGLLASSCAAIAHEAELQQRLRCSPEGAFELGMKAGRAGEESDLRFAAGCDETAAPAARAGYLDGFREGLGVRAAEARERGWTCEVGAFGQVYTGSARVEARAADEARARCRAEQDEPFCRDVRCRPGA